MGGSSVEEGHKVSREYTVSDACISELRTEMAGLNFEEVGKGHFVAERGEGWVETVMIDPPQIASEANLVWEETYP